MNKILLKTLLVIALYPYAGLATSAQELTQELPTELQELYDARPDSRYSDEFNAKRPDNSFDTKKWHFRRSTKIGLGQDKAF